MYLIGGFPREGGQARGRDPALQAAGIDAGDMDVFSEEPVEFPRGVLDRPSRMSLAAVVGAIVAGHWRRPAFTGRSTTTG